MEIIVAENKTITKILAKIKKNKTKERLMVCGTEQEIDEDVLL